MSELREEIDKKLIRDNRIVGALEAIRVFVESNGVDEVSIHALNTLFPHIEREELANLYIKNISYLEEMDEQDSEDIDYFISFLLDKDGHVCKCLSCEEFFIQIQHDPLEKPYIPVSIPNSVINYAIKKKGADKALTTIVLTIAHLDQDVQNNHYNNLKALCQRCHLSHDRKFRDRIKKRDSFGRLNIPAKDKFVLLGEIARFFIDKGEEVREIGGHPEIWSFITKWFADHTIINELDLAEFQSNLNNKEQCPET